MELDSEAFVFSMIKTTQKKSFLEMILGENNNKNIDKCCSSRDLWGIMG